MSELKQYSEETIELSVVGWNGNPTYCVYLNSFRIAGGKPWGGADYNKNFAISIEDLREALRDVIINKDLRTDNEQLKVRVTELSNALLVEKANNARMREMVRRIDDYAEEAIIDSYKRTEKQAHHDLRRFAQSTRQRCEHALKGGE